MYFEPLVKTLVGYAGIQLAIPTPFTWEYPCATSLAIPKRVPAGAPAGAGSH